MGQQRARRVRDDDHHAALAAHARHAGLDRAPEAVVRADRLAGVVVSHSTDERGLPVSTLSVEGTDYDFRRARRIGATRLDHAFTDLERGPDGLARVELAGSRAGRRLTLWVDETYVYLMLFTGDPLPDVARRSIAVEPMTCPPNAFRTGEAVIRLEAGATVRSVWGITPP